MRRVLILIQAFLFTGLLLSAQDEQSAKQMEAREKASTIIHAGDMAPDFTVEMLDGRKIKLSEQKGKVVLLNFWATWCGPCMMEFKEIPEKIVKRFKGTDFVFLPISREEKREVVAEKMKNLAADGIDFPVGIDPSRIIYSLYAKEFIPRNFIIDRNGKVVYEVMGYDEKKLDEIASRIESLLKSK